MTAQHPRWCERDIDGKHTRLVGVDSTGYHFEITQAYDAPEPLFSMIRPERPDEFSVIGLTMAQLYAIGTLINSTLSEDVGGLMDVAWEYAVGIHDIADGAQFDEAMGLAVKEMVTR